MDIATGIELVLAFILFIGFVGLAAMSKTSDIVDVNNKFFEDYSKNKTKV